MYALFLFVQHRRAMRAAGRVIGDFTLTERADALGLRRRRFSLLVNLIHRADDEEHAERRQDEVDDILDKQTIVHRADAGSRSRLNGRIALPVERNEQPRKIDAARQHTDQRHEDVVDQRCGNRTKRRADDYADSHVDDISAHGKRFEVLKKLWTA